MKFKEKQLQGLFETSETLHEGELTKVKTKGEEVKRYYYLKANFLFYALESGEKPIGVIIIEEAEVSADVNIAYGLQISFPASFGIEPVILAASSTVSQYNWIAAIKTASQSRLIQKIRLLPSFPLSAPYLSNSPPVNIPIDLPELTKPPPPNESSTSISSSASSIFSATLRRSKSSATTLTKSTFTTMPAKLGRKFSSTEDNLRIFYEPESLLLSINCTNLRASNVKTAKELEFQIIVYHLEKEEWIEHSKTEVAKGENEITSLTFLTSIEIPKEETSSSSYKFTLISMEDIQTEKVNYWGSIIVPCSKIYKFIGNKVSDTLKSDDGSISFGQLHISPSFSCSNEHFFLPQTPNCPVTFFEFLRETKTYLIRDDSNQNLRVREVMLESPYAFAVPFKFFKLVEAEEKEMMKFLFQTESNLSHALDEAKKKHMEYHRQILNFAQKNTYFLNSQQSASFRASVYKKEEHVQAIPVNCHSYLLIVNSSQSKAMYGMVTFGAAAAHFYGYKKGGAKSLIQTHFEDVESQNLEGGEIKQRGMSFSKKSILKQFKFSQSQSHNETQHQPQTQSEPITQFFLQIPNQETGPTTISQFQSQSQDPEWISESTIKYLPSTTQYAFLENLRKEFDEVCNIIAPHFDALKKSPTIPVLSPIVPLIEEKFLPVVEKILIILTNSVSSTISEKEENLEGLTTLIVKSRLPSFRTVYSEIITLVQTDTINTKEFSTFSAAFSSLVKDIGYICFLISNNIATNLLLDPTIFLNTSLRMRLDLIFSQALTSLVTVFSLSLNIMITTNVTEDERLIFFSQLKRMGYLVHFESLLSTHQDELGMLEDHMIAIESLRRVTFQFKLYTPTEKTSTMDLKNENPIEFAFDIQGKREAMTVIIYLQSNRFRLLSEELKEGHKIAVVPVLFSQGINEAQTISNALRSSTLQDKINNYYINILTDYLMQFLDVHFKVFGEVKEELNDLVSQMQDLRKASTSKKLKKVDLLEIACSVTRKVNGGRITSCKSAKDRTSMSSTLEFTHLLEDNHNVHSNSKRTLDAFRSQGVRVLNAEKNIGKRKYAFNVFQQITLPKDYRPPKGSGGANVS